jgi:Carbohydrate esterase, sialic acid-specific acetylesterase
LNAHYQFLNIVFLKGFLMKYFLTLSIIFLSFISTKISAQISITYPTSRAIFQRNNSNISPIYIAGNYTSFADKIEARAIARPMIPSQGITTNWTTIQLNPSNGYFYGSLNVSGGWYDLEVRHWNGTILLGTASIQRIGVGEVFLIAGQSNATGDEGLKNQGNYGPMANDDRVSIVNYTVNYPTNYGGIVLPRAEFSHLDSTFNISPFGVSAWCWGALGDTLTKRLNVPIAFFNGGWSGTGSNAWRESANDTTATPFNFFSMPRGMPYGNLRASLHFYAAQFGVRAVLWHQGETDNVQEVNRDNYGINLKTVITKSREHSGKPNLAWVVSKASRFKGFQITNSRIWQPVIDGQNDVIGVNGNAQTNYTTQVFEGPSTDGLVGPNVRTSDSIHFVGNGHRILASVWNQKLNTDFFTNSNPYLPVPPPTLTSDCNGVTSLLIMVSNSYNSPQWTDNNSANNNLSNSLSYTASSGNYRVKLKDSNNNILISPQIAIPSNFSGLIPIVSQNSGTWHDYTTWKCGRIPTSVDYVTISAGQEVIISSGLTGRFKKLELKGNVRLFNTSKLQN